MGRPLSNYDNECGSESDNESPSRPEFEQSCSDSDSDAPEMVTQEKSKQLAQLQRSTEMQSQRYLKEQRKKRLRTLAEQMQKSSKAKIEAAKMQKLSGDIIECIQDVLEDDPEGDHIQEDSSFQYFTSPRPQRVVKDGFELQVLTSVRNSNYCHQTALELYKLESCRHKRSISYRDARPAAQFVAGSLHQ